MLQAQETMKNLEYVLKTIIICKTQKCSSFSSSSHVVDL